MLHGSQRSDPQNARSLLLHYGFQMAPNQRQNLPGFSRWITHSKRLVHRPAHKFNPSLFQFIKERQTQHPLSNRKRFRKISASKGHTVHDRLQMRWRKVPASLNPHLAQLTPYFVSINPRRQKHRIRKPAYPSCRKLAVTLQFLICCQITLVASRQCLTPFQNALDPQKLSQSQSAVEIRKAVAVTDLAMLKPLR